MDKILLKIIENPDAKNSYLKLINYYKEHKQDDLAQAIEYLIQKKFHDHNYPAHEKQSRDLSENPGIPPTAQE
jgi:hypothetical protein